LKEVAVDCRLQNDVPSAALNEIELSTDGKRIPFQYKSYSALCDYMDNCNLVCRPQHPRESNFRVTASTYSTPFVGYAVDRVRHLFQEQAVWERRDIFTALQRPRQIPVEHVYLALTQLVESKDPVLFDKYGRRGYLVNSGLKYAFQPTEITDELSTARERSVPVDEKPVAVAQQNATTPNHTELLQGMEQGVALATTETKMKSLSSLDPVWCRHVRNLFNELQVVHGMSPTQIRQYVVQHLYDGLSLTEKVCLLQHMYARVRSEWSPTETLLKTYLDARFRTTDSGETVFVAEKGKMYQQLKGKEWIEKEVEEEEEEDATGFVQGGRVHVRFQRHKRGIALENLSKADVLVLMNEELLPGATQVYGKKNNEMHMGVLVELLLRHFQAIGKDGRRNWFLA
jgi:hypothetical protein